MQSKYNTVNVYSGYFSQMIQFFCSNSLKPLIDTQCLKTEAGLVVLVRGLSRNGGNKTGAQTNAPVIFNTACAFYAIASSHTGSSTFSGMNCGIGKPLNAAAYSLVYAPAS